MNKLCLAAILLFATPLAAQDNGARDAAKHFERGAELYGEANYPAALIEFKRAYALVPNTDALYNVGETQYQLQDYAAARASFLRFLSEAPPSSKRRAEVESTLAVLRGRVARLQIVTVPPGADVTVDDQPVGKTPFDEAVVVSIGKHKVVASLPGKRAVTKTVELAGDDNASVALELTEPPSPVAVARRESSLLALAPHVPQSDGQSHGGVGPRMVGIIVTGILTAGAVTSGILALSESADLRTARQTYPTSSDTLQRDSNLTLAYSIIADVLGGGALVASAATLISALTAHTHGPKVIIGLGSARVEWTF